MQAVSSTDRLAWWQRTAGILAIAAIAGMILAVADAPTLIDLPAHIARYHVQQDVAHSPQLAKFFTFEWRFIPNLGVDLAVAALAPILGVETAVRLIVAAIPAIMVAGFLLSAREAHGRLPWTALFAAPIAFAYPLIFGFVNYWLSAALAMLAFSLWLKMTRGGHVLARSIVFALIAPMIVVAHMIGFGVLGLLCFGSLIGLRWQSGKLSAAGIGRAILECLPLAWPAILLLIWQTGEHDGTGMWLDLNRISVWAVSIVRTQWMVADVASAVILYAVALLPLMLRRHFRYSPTLIVPAALLALAVVALPRQINGSDYASVRLIPLACALGILAVQPKALRSAVGEPLALGFVAIRFAIMFVVTIVASARADRELAALDHIERGSHVIAFHISPCKASWEPRRLVHISSMATTRRDAMINDYFAATGGQLMQLTAAETAKTWVPTNDVRPLGCQRSDTVLFDASLRKTDLSKIDYLWLIDQSGMAMPQDARLRRIWSKPGSVLFKVIQPTPAT